MEKVEAEVRSGGWFAHPVSSTLIAATWLLLQQSASAANVLCAIVLALVIPRLVGGLTGPATGLRLRALPAIVRLTGLVLFDIAVSNVAVAKIVLNPWRSTRPAWVPVALDITHPAGIAALAGIITMTPGTVSCVVDETRRELLVHALDCDDAAALALDIKTRYEMRLKEIFE